MEKDRYQQNHALYIISMISMVLSISIFCFTAYILPFLLFGWIYNVPGFIIHWQVWMQRHYGMTDLGSSSVLFLFFFGLGLIAAIIAYITSNRLENEVLDIHPENKDDAIRIKRDVKESASILSKIVIIVICIFVALALLEWMLYVPPVIY